MSLETPELRNLDNLRFQALVDEARRRIPVLFPDWTDYNVSDPGITLIELFAWMTELIVYRLNKVPEKNYIKFLEMLGVQRHPPKPARAELTFRLSTPFPLRRDDFAEKTTTVVNQGFPVSTGIAKDQQKEAIFTVERDLVIVTPRLRHLRQESNFGQNCYPETPREERKFTFPAFAPDKPPQLGSKFYLGFDENTDISGHVLRLHFTCEKNRGDGVRRDVPPVQWECYVGKTIDKNGLLQDDWQRVIKVGEAGDEKDSTGGFNNETGSVTLYLPLKMEAGIPVEAKGRRLRAYWLRCCYIDDPDDPNNRYTQSPVIKWIHPETVGATVAASNAVCHESEELGVSTGEPGQRFRLAQEQLVDMGTTTSAGPGSWATSRQNGATGQTSGRAPALALHEYPDPITDIADALAREENEIVTVEEFHRGKAQFVPWEQVHDFMNSSPGDRHYRLDRTSGEIIFGPAIRQANGEIQQYGRIPLLGRRIRIHRYWSSVGAQGNVAAGRLTVMHAAVPYVDSVTNYAPALGGADAESVEAAQLRARAELSTQQRAVTASDYEQLLLRARLPIARLRCLPATAPMASNLVQLVVVPKTPPTGELTIPDQLITDIETYLDPYRLLATKLYVRPPRYRGVRILAEIVDDEQFRQQRDQLKMKVIQKLNDWISPITLKNEDELPPLTKFGFAVWQGWPFDEPLLSDDLYTLIQQVEGVKRVRHVEIQYGDLTSGECPSLPGVEPSALQTTSASAGLPLKPVEGGKLALERDMLFYSLDHEIKFTP